MIDFTKQIKNSNKFRQAAIQFQKYGYYCNAPQGTKEYQEYWEEEMHRCIDGYTAEDGDWISGYNYFYLNYCPIVRIVEQEYTDRFGNNKTRRVREREFADFYDYDYYFFTAVQEAEDLGKHLVVLKSRRKGYEQPYSTKLPTPTGFRQFGDLKIGDSVFGPNGNITTVTNIYEQGYTDVYEMLLDDGRTVRCGANHLWKVINATNKFKEEIRTTHDILNRGLFNTYAGYNHYRFYLDKIDPVPYDEQKLPIDPYILGALLGDGTINKKGKSIKISTTDKEIVDRFTLLLGNDYTLVRDKSCYNYRINYNKRFDKIVGSKYENGQYGVNPLSREITALGLNVLCQYKFIPTIYKYSSIEQRFELVRGLMDTDGTISVDGSCMFANTSKQLVDDLAEVLRSLGIRCEIGTYKKDGCKLLYRLYIRTNEDIFHLTRKLSRINKNKKVNEKVAIIDIRRLGYEEKQRCIEVAADDHMYLTEQYIPTHNSFKTASMLCRNYYCIPESKSYAYAAENEFLIKDGIITKAWEYMDFIDEHTAWGKKRQKVDTKMHRRASMVITDDMGNKTEVGYKSEIIGVTLKNDTQKIRGKAGKLIVFEEGGKFPGLLEAWQIARPSVEQDGMAFGLMIAFGTGGSEGADFEGLKDMFYHPEGYNCLALPNIWDEGTSTNTSGFFIPQYTNLDVKDDSGKGLYMDSNGNTYVEKAKDYIISLRNEVIENSTSTQAIDRYVAENCLTPSEACLEVSGNIFPKKELQQQLATIRMNRRLQNHKQVGDLIWNSGVLEWKQKKLGDITKYPLSKNDDTTGSIVIWEHPMKDAPHGLYISGNDPYDMDSSGTTSLGSTFIYKRFQNFEEYYDIIVAEYTGRPETADEYYENVRKLLIYYNATLLYENEKKGLFTYFTNKHCDYLLADQPDIINDIIKNSNVQRRKGIHMNQQIKDYGERLIKEWLNEEYAPGYKNLTKIFSEPLLEELISYNNKGNFDRVIALIMVMIYRIQLHNLHVKDVEDTERKKYLFSKPLFNDTSSGGLFDMVDDGNVETLIFGNNNKTSIVYEIQ